MGSLKADEQSGKEPGAAKTLQWKMKPPVIFRAREIGSSVIIIGRKRIMFMEWVTVLCV